MNKQTRCGICGEDCEDLKELSKHECDESVQFYYEQVLGGKVEDEQGE